MNSVKRTIRALQRPVLRIMNRGTHSRLRVIIFYHIGKTGGSAVNRLFVNTVRGLGGTIQEINFPLHLDQDFNIDRLANLENKLNKLNNGLCYMHCHHGSPGIIEAYDLFRTFSNNIQQRGGEIAVTTVFREPFKRMISNIRFNDIAISDARKFAERRSNLMSRYLLYNHPRLWTPESANPRLDDLRKALSLFDVVGCQDDLNKFTEKVFKKIDFSPEKTIVSRVNVTNPKKNDDLITKEIEYAKFRCENELDYWLYDKYKNTLN